MKKYLFPIFALVFVVSFTSCGNDSAQTAQNTVESTVPSDSTISDDTKTSEDTDASEESAKPSENTTNDNNSSSSGEDIEAGLGDLVLDYNKNWTYDESQSADNSLVFVRDNALIGVSCSEEDSYQSPKDMANTDTSLAAGSDGYKLLQEMKELSVNGEKWIEVKYQTGTGDETQITLKRFYGNNYYAYSISYMAYKDEYDSYAKDATRILNSVKMDVPSNTDGQNDAMDTLVGEYDVGDDGYLVLNKDNTYAWYASKDKDKDNYHSGTFGCDNKINSLGITAGHGIYLVLFPEEFYDNGKESDMGTYKIEIAISTVTDSDADYDFSGLNMKTSKVYYFKKDN